MIINSQIASGNLMLEQVLRQLSSNQGVPAMTGNIYFVIPATNSNYVQFVNQYQQTYADGSLMVQLTLAKALTACTSNRGDFIYIAPGYTETIVGAAGQSISKSGVSIIGLGNGAKRPTFTFTTAIAASFDVSGNDVSLSNCRFINGIDAQTAMFNITGADFSFIGNEVQTNTATTGVVLGILTAATATRLKLENNFFVGPAVNSGTTTTAQVKHEVGTDYIIRNNYFAGKMTQSIFNVTTVLRGLIEKNKFVVGTGTAAITMAAASTPFIVNNRMNVASGTAPIVAAAGFVAGNVYSAAAGVTAGAAITI